MKKLLASSSLALLCVSMASFSATLSAAEVTPEQGFAVLQKYCIACHGPQQQKSGLRLDTAAWFAKGGESGELLLDAKKLEDSFLWYRVAKEEMPPDGKPQPSPAEKEILKQWVLAGAKYPQAPTVKVDPVVLASQAYDVLKRTCYACHGQQVKAEGLFVLKHETLVNVLPGKTKPYVVAGNHADSLLWKKIYAEAPRRPSMPPKPRNPLSSDEVALLTRWIDAGAPRWPDLKIARPFVGDLDVQRAIRDDLIRPQLSRKARENQRYFSFTHLHNNQNISDRELALYKAALSKAINSLTWEAEIVVPRPVDKNQTIFAVDLRDLDWTEPKHWNEVLKRYPYGLNRSFINREFGQMDREVRAQTGNPVSRLLVRGDWFVAKATRGDGVDDNDAGLYHLLLELPDTDKELEKKLEVTVEDDWLNGHMERGALQQSKVSTQNRLVDRHRGLHGYYWKSYDFASDVNKGNLIRNPLGPKFEKNPFNDTLAFEHDGGEIIYSLPNGLQAYFLADSKGKRITTGPPQIVFDANQTSGTTLIVNGLSCMSCHKNGMIRFQDTVGPTALKNLQGEDRDKVQDLYPPVAEMNERLRKDEERFLRAMLEVVGPFLDVKTTDDVRQLPEEPVGSLARHYIADLDLAAVAADLNEDPERLKLKIELLPELGPILGTLLGEGGVIKRANWDTKNGNTISNFQKAARILKKGTPN